MRYVNVTTIALTVTLASALAQPQAQTPRGGLEGVVLETGDVSPRRVVGARITVTKVNPSTGATLQIPGRTQGTSRLLPRTVRSASLESCRASTASVCLRLRTST